MNSSHSLLCLLASLALTLVCSATISAPRSAGDCLHRAIGTTQPNTSGTPILIDSTTGTVISANFFNSGAIIYSPYFDGNEFVSVCVVDPALSQSAVAQISTDVGLKDDSIIKGYPEFIFGTKFGNQFETSFRYYSNTGLPPTHQWPVESTNLASNNQPFKLANLEYISQIKGLGLPAFTDALPQIDITLDLAEENVVGAERDVMLESWFYDTSANAMLIGNNVATGEPIANTLNNIIGVGHPHYNQLDNTLLEMMVHIGPLSKNDISNATRNPGKFQLTETYSGLDFDGDGIDDHFDVDSHVNKNNSQQPRPGKYSSGIDANNDGIDDEDLLPITIGDYQYSIWYGTTHLAPLVIYSRETNVSLTSDFNPSTPDMNLSQEGEINLNWNLFLDYTLFEVQALLQQKQVTWSMGQNNLFDKMRLSSGAIGGLEIGVEPQINYPADEPYVLNINKLDVTVDGRQIGIGPDITKPVGLFSYPASGAILPANGTASVSGNVSDNFSGIDRGLVRIRRLSSGSVSFWNGSAWQNSPALVNVAFDSAGDFNIDAVDLSSDGSYLMQINVKDNAGNVSSATENPVLRFSVAPNETTKPIGSFTFPANNSSLHTNSSVAITGNVSDEDSGVDRALVRIRRLTSDSVSFWNGTAWQSSPALVNVAFDNAGDFSIAAVDLSAVGSYLLQINVKDYAGNISLASENATRHFSVEIDTTNPTGVFSDPIDTTMIPPNSSATISGSVDDDLAGVDRALVRLRRLSSGSVSFWNGSAWQNSPTLINVAFDNAGDFAINSVDLSSVGSYVSQINVKDNAGNISLASENPTLQFSISQ